MRKSRVKKRKNRRLTVREKVAREIEALPKYLKQAIEEDKDQLIKIISNQIKEGYDKDQITGKRYTPKQIIRNYARGEARRQGIGTIREMYRLFRESYFTRGVYAKYNSYMYRKGYSASQYFYANAETDVDGSVVKVTVSLPEGGKYETLEIYYDYSPKGPEDEIEANLY